jgi:hypothetical protein
MTKYTKLTIIGSCLIAVVFILVLIVLIGIARGTSTEPTGPKKKTADQDTVKIVVEKIVYSKPDTIRIIASCKKKHCEDSEKPKGHTDSTITQITN